MTVAACIDTAAKLFHLPRRVFLSQCRDTECCKARFAVMWVARERLNYSYPQIGRFLGGRDHTTIISGYKRAVELREADSVYRAITDAMLIMELPVECPCCGKPIAEAV